MARHLRPANRLACVRCGQRATNLHHRLPRSRGGPDDDFNVVPLCGSGTTGCHGWVHANPDEAEKVELYVRGSCGRGGYVGANVEYRERYGDGRRWEGDPAA